MTKGWNGQYLASLNYEQKQDYYEKQVAFWESVVAKYPRNQSKAVLSRMKTLKQEHENNERTKNRTNET